MYMRDEANQITFFSNMCVYIYTLVQSISHLKIDQNSCVEIVLCLKGELNYNKKVSDSQQKELHLNMLRLFNNKIERTLSFFSSSCFYFNEDQTHLLALLTCLIEKGSRRHKINLLLNLGWWSQSRLEANTLLIKFICRQ